MDERIIKIQHVLKKELDDNRYQHTLGVMYTAASMAMCYDVDVLKALYAGLLHDCAKCIPNDKKLHLCGVICRKGKSKPVTCQTRCVSGS